MAWKMPWDKEDPVDARLRELERQSAALAAKEARIRADLALPPETPVEKLPEPKVPVSRLETDEFMRPDPPATRHNSPRVLSAKRRQDRNKFIIYLCVLVLILFWLFQVIF
jgi:hypothetical protein